MNDVQWQSTKPLQIHVVLPVFPIYLWSERDFVLKKQSYLLHPSPWLETIGLCCADVLSVPNYCSEGLGLLGDLRELEPLIYLPSQPASLFQSACSAFPVPFLDYGVLVNPEDPGRIQFPSSFVWPQIIVPFPVQRLIIQTRDILCISNLILPKVLSFWKERPGCSGMNFSWNKQTWSLLSASKQRKGMRMQAKQYILKLSCFTHITHITHTPFYL